MRSEKITALLIAFLLILLPAVLSGCESETAVSSAPEPTPTAALEPTPTPEATPEATPTPEAASTPDPTPDVNFEEIFSQNPIDAKMTDALDNAFTNRAIYNAYATAEADWRKVVEGVYPLALECFTEEEQEELNANQEAWQAEMAKKLPAIQEEAGDTEDGKIDAAAQIAELYRARALALCQVCYTVTGELPDFEALIDSAPMG